MTRHPSTFFLILLALYPALASAEDGPAEDVPELEVLSNYIGKWDFAYTSEKPPLSKGEFTGQWILGGRFVEQVGELTAVRVPNDIKVKMLMTYDHREQVYRRWTFISNGRALVASGTWDPKDRTMTWVSEYDERRSRTTTYTTIEVFTKDGVMEWKKVAKGPGDPIGDHSSGTSLRREQ